MAMKNPIRAPWKLFMAAAVAIKSQLELYLLAGVDEWEKVQGTCQSQTGRHCFQTHEQACILSVVNG